MSDDQELRLSALEEILHNPRQDDQELRLSTLEEILHNPRHVVERRVERFGLPSRDKFSWDVDVQIALPDDGSSGLGRYIISLGLYEKRRTPDLIVTDAAGARLPVSSRHARGAYISQALLRTYFLEASFTFGGGTYNAIYVKLKHSMGLNELDEAEKCLLNITRHVEATVATILISSPDDARTTLNAVRDSLEQSSEDGGWPEILERRFYEDGTAFDLYDHLTGLIGSVHVLAEVSARAEDRLTLNVCYGDVKEDADQTHTFTPIRSTADSTGMAKVENAILAMPFAKRIWRSHIYLGLLATSIEWPARNADHCQSYYLIADPPDGVTVCRGYWQNLNRDSRSPEVLPYYPANGEDNGSILTMHDDDGDAAEFPAVATFDLQVRPDTWLRTSWAQTFALFLLTVLVWAGALTQQSPNVTYMFGIPAGVLGILTLVSDSFSASVSKQVRRVLLAIAVLAIGYVVGFSVDASKIPLIGGLDLLRLYNSLVGAFTVLVVGTVGVLSFLPRRHPEEVQHGLLTSAEVFPWKRRQEARVVFGSLVSVLVSIVVLVAYL